MLKPHKRRRREPIRKLKILKIKSSQPELRKASQVLNLEQVPMPRPRIKTWRMKKTNDDRNDPNY
jgi:hypothetical protein